MTESKALKPIEKIRKDLQRMKGEFEMVLPKHINSDKFVRMAQTTIATNKDLLDCDRATLFASLVDCARDGLVPDGREATIQKFGPKASYMPMVGGICKRARNSGEIKCIDAVVVRENDEYESWVDEGGQKFKFKKAQGDRGKDLLTFAYALTKDGGLYFEEIDEEQMKAIEAKAKHKAIWTGPFRAEMKRKSALHRLCKYRVPSSADLEHIFDKDKALYDLDGGEPSPGQTPESGKPTNLSNIINSQDEPEASEPQAPPEEEAPVVEVQAGVITTDDDELPI